nr:glycosyltransferase family 25 protein [Helicobacter sp. 11S02596-1]
MIPGELGCFASHYLLWEKCVQINESIIVLEDDIEILPNFFDALTHIAKNRFEYVRLMQLSTAKSCQLDEHFGFLKHYAFGTQGYYLTPKGAQKFLRYAKKWVEPVDLYMDRYWKHGVLNVIYTPCPIRQNTHALESTIGNRGSSLYIKISMKNWLFFKCAGMIYRYERLTRYFYDKFILNRHF